MEVCIWLGVVGSEEKLRSSELTELMELMMPVSRVRNTR